MITLTMHNTDTIPRRDDKKLHCSFNITPPPFFFTMPAITRIEVKIDQQRPTKTDKSRQAKTINKEQQRRTPTNKEQDQHKPTKFLSYEAIECDTNVTHITN